jgi:O-antigen/teichoic acid export membrane protein
MTLAGIACATSFALVAGYERVLVIGTLVAGVGLLIQVSSDVLSIALQAQLQLGRLTAVELSRRLLALMLFGALALSGAGLLSFFAASVAAAALALLLLSRVVRSVMRLRLRFDWQAWRSMFADSAAYAVAMSIGAVYFYVTVIVMSLTASAQQTGIFATSFRVVQVALAVPVLLLTAIFPLMTRGPDHEASDASIAFGKVFAVAIIGGVWMSLAMAMGASFIIDVVAGSPGQAAVPVLQIQGIVLAVSFISTSSALGLISQRRYRPMVVASCSALVLNIALAILLIPVLGAEGGAVADVATEALVAVGLTIALLHANPTQRVSATTVRALLLATSLSALVFLIPIGSPVRVVAATLIYFAILLRARVIPTDVLDAVRRTGLRRTSHARR